MIVVDASALLAAVSAPSQVRALDERLSRESALHVPHLIDLEILSALRRLSASGSINDDAALVLRRDIDGLPLVRYPHHPFRNRLWELRHNFTPYDGAYVALAEALGAPLATVDRRLGRAAEQLVHVEIYGAD